MSIPLTVNGVTFQYPQQFDRNWGPTLTGWSTAVTNVLAAFPSTGVLTLSPSPAAAINFANATNTGFLALTVNGSNQLTFNGVPIAAASSLTNGHIFVGDVTNNASDVAMTGDITISNTGVTTLGALKVANAQIATLAGIAFTKLASTSPYYWYVANSAGVLSPIGVTASKVVITDANGLPSASSVTPTTLSYLDATSSVQTQINAITGGFLALSGGTLSGNLALSSNKITGVSAGTGAGEVMVFGQALTGTTLTLSGALTGATSGSFSGILTLGDQLRVPDGNVAAPAYSFVNETNTGVYRSASHEMSIAVNGQQEIIVQPKQVFIGGKTQDTQPSELLHAEGWGGVIPNDVSADIIVYNTNNYAGRVIASTSSPAGGPYPHPIVTSYLTAYGYNDAGPSWSGGPSFQDAAEVALQNSTHQLFRIIDGGATTYFWNDGASGIWSFRHSSSGTEDAQISEKGMIPARLASDPGTPTEGTIYYNTSSKHWFGYNGSTWKQLDN
jgi:hypothetical protein